jgi:hypothetical protein
MRILAPVLRAVMIGVFCAIFIGTCIMINNNGVHITKDIHGEIWDRNFEFMFMFFASLFTVIGFGVAHKITDSDSGVYSVIAGLSYLLLGVAYGYAFSRVNNRNAMQGYNYMDIVSLVLTAVASFIWANKRHKFTYVLTTGTPVPTGEVILKSVANSVVKLLSNAAPNVDANEAVKYAASMNGPKYSSDLPGFGVAVSLNHLIIAALSNLTVAFFFEAFVDYGQVGVALMFTAVFGLYSSMWSPSGVASWWEHFMFGFMYLCAVMYVFTAFNLGHVSTFIPAGNYRHLYFFQDRGNTRLQWNQQAIEAFRYTLASFSMLFAIVAAMISLRAQAVVVTKA